MHSILQSIIDVMKIYQAGYPEDACLLLFDHEKLIGYLPGEKLDFKLPLGTRIEDIKGTVVEKTWRTRSSHPLREERGSEQFGFAYISTAVPIFDEGSLIAIFSMVVSNEKMDTLRSASTDLATTITELTTITDQIAHASSNVANYVEELSGQSLSVKNDIERISSVLSFIQKVSTQSKILGLNASIEAARAGEHGRGFSIVAKEIQKMSEQSRTAAEDITNQLENIAKSITHISEAIQQIAAHTEENAATSEEMKAAFDTVSYTAEKLMQVVEKGMGASQT